MCFFCGFFGQNSLNCGYLPFYVMESGSFVAVVSAVLTVVSVFLGAKYRKWLEKGRLLATLLDDIIEAAEDDKVSEEEFQNIVAKTKQVIAEVEQQKSPDKGV